MVLCYKLSILNSFFKLMCHSSCTFFRVPYPQKQKKERLTDDEISNLKSNANSVWLMVLCCKLSIFNCFFTRICHSCTFSRFRTHKRKKEPLTEDEILHRKSNANSVWLMVLCLKILNLSLFFLNLLVIFHCSSMI